MSSKRIPGRTATLGLLLFCFNASAFAEDWPGWRKDGSGVSAETKVPVEWSADRNIRWCVPISGVGHSSPIVYGDQVFVTAVRPTIERHRLAPAALIALSLLCALVLWRLTDGTFGDPLGIRPENWATESFAAKGSRRSLVWLLFLVISYGTVCGVEIAYDYLERYPESLRARVIDKTWYFTDAPGYEELDTPISMHRAITGKAVEGPFFGSPRIPYSCFYGGILAILSVLAVNTAISRRRESNRQPTVPAEIISGSKRLFQLRLNLLGMNVNFGVRAQSPLDQILRKLSEWIGCFAAACGLIAIHSAAMADLPFVPSGTTWFLSASIVVLALMAFNLFLPARPWLRLLGVLVTGAVLAYIILEAPPNEEFGIYATALRAGLRPIFKMLLAVAAFALLVAWLSPTKPASQSDAAERRRQWSIGLAAVAILLSSGLYFALSNFLLPQNVHAREVIAVNRNTGDVMWTAQCDSGETSGKLHAANTMATPTPVTDGEHVFAHFGEAGLFCLDMQGDVQWSFDEPVQPSHWGAASSPVLWNDLVVMTYDTDHQSLSIGIDKRNGKERWRANRTNQIEPSQLYDAYSTPIIIQRNGGAELIHLACKLLSGYDPATGAERWTFPYPGEQPVATPVVADDLIVILGGRYAPYLAGVRVSSGGENAEPEVEWEGTRSLSDMPSPVIYDGLLYMVTKDGIATCIDVETGDYQWRRRLRGAYWSSVTAADGKIYFSNAEGATTVIEAGPKYTELSFNEVGDGMHASMAISNSQIFLRTTHNLICIAADE